MWQVFILIICFGVYLLAGAVISYCFWYLLLLVFRPLKLERLFGIELPLPIVLSLLGIGIWYGYNINNFLSEYSSKKETTERKENVPIKKETSYSVYICTGETSTKYHSDPDCRGLSSCSGEIEEVSEEEAEDMGRTPCKICY